MEYSETKTLMKRISSNYPSFICDDYKTKEWHKELKHYDFDDVNKKLEEHMRSTEYGIYEPKVYFLTKHLKTTEQKNTSDSYLLQCPFCKMYVPEEKFEDHYDRCSDVDYIVRKRKELFNEETSEELQERYKKLSKEDFDNKYIVFLDKIYNYVSKDEQKRLEKIIKLFSSANKVL